jgi:hypothetical protein
MSEDSAILWWLEEEFGEALVDDEESCPVRSMGDGEGGADAPTSGTFRDSEATS